MSLTTPDQLPRSCVSCIYRRRRAEPALFAANELQSASTMKAQLEWDQEVRQRAHQEMQRFLANQPFTYEPHTYEWCEKATPIDKVKRAAAGDVNALAELMSGGAATLNPVSGEIAPIYMLCARKNPDGRCSDYSAR